MTTTLRTSPASASTQRCGGADTAIVSGLRWKLYEQAPGQYEERLWSDLDIQVYNAWSDKRRIVLALQKLTPQLVSTLVEPFQRGSRRIRTDHAGVGLGLAIVNSITQAHGGTLTLTPGPPAGSASRCNYPSRQLTDR